MSEPIVSTSSASATAAVATVPPPVKSGDFFSGIIGGVNGFLNSNPLIKNILDATVHVALISGLTFVAATLAPGSATVLTVSGIVAAVGAGVKSYAQHQADVYVQNQIDSIAPVVDVVKPVSNQTTAVK